jgi:hypothetical protein
MKDKVDKITRITIREAFPIEPKHFTPWLTDNIDVVGDAIGVELVSPEREQSTGNFSVDIKAKTVNGETVIIENQYGNSDHDHLGKLITYLSSFGASVAIWIVENPKQEHINAITWLNEGENNCDFYILRVEAIRIGESPAAPLLSLIAGPSIESKQIGKKRQSDSENDLLRSEFWELLIQQTTNKNIKHFAAINATGKDAWIGATAGKKGFTYVYWVNQNSCRIELRIDRGKDSEDENMELFNILKSYCQEIEQGYGGELNWADLEGYRVCSIRVDFEGGYKSPKEAWQNLTNNLAERMKKLIEATTKYVKELKI